MKGARAKAWPSFFENPDGEVDSAEGKAYNKAMESGFLPVTKEELRAAFDVFKQLIYRDERVSYKDVLSLFHVMISTYKWDHYMYFCLLPPI